MWLNVGLVQARCDSGPCVADSFIFVGPCVAVYLFLVGLCVADYLFWLGHVWLFIYFIGPCVAVLSRGDENREIGM